MRVLVDTSIWFRFFWHLQQADTIESVLKDSRTRRFLSPFSVLEIVRKWRAGKLPCPDPETWLDQAMEGFEELSVTAPIARQAAWWDWEHKDPADRIIAATAKVHAIELWHSDTVLRDLRDFPHRYFKAVLS